MYPVLGGPLIFYGTQKSPFRVLYPSLLLMLPLALGKEREGWRCNLGSGGGGSESAAGHRGPRTTAEMDQKCNGKAEEAAKNVSDN